MRKTIVSFIAAALVLAACNNEASNKEAQPTPAAAKEAPITEVEAKALKDSSTANQSAPAQSATPVAWKGVKEINDAEFAQKVLNNPGLTIVDFNAICCGPCKMLKPILDKAANDFAGKASFASIDVDENRSLSEQYKVQSIPLLLFFKGGKVVKSIEGLVGAKELYTAIEKNL
jgi:thioredoxin 1